MVETVKGDLLGELFDFRFEVRVRTAREIAVHERYEDEEQEDEVLLGSEAERGGKESNNLREDADD